MPRRWPGTCATELIEHSATRARILESYAPQCSPAIARRADHHRLLDYAEEHGVAPSTRELAPLLGVSHTSVAKALARFRALLAEAD